LFAQGHSFGAVVTLARLLDQPDRYRAGVISGAPLVPIPELLDTNSAFDLDPLWLSEDPFYLDAMVNDPLAFVDADGAPLARALDTAWDRFGKDLPGLTVPTLAVQLKEFACGHHDILNDTMHREVASAILEFLGESA
jgi:pimeloyl-ACP methyl ester carboxylesterase